MSLPRIPRKHLQGRTPVVSAEDYRLHEGPNLAGRRLPTFGPGAPALTFLPGMRTLEQRPNLPIWAPDPPSSPATEDTPRTDRHIHMTSEFAPPSPIGFEVEPDWSARYGRKKERQWARWANEVIPVLVEPYLDYLAGGKQQPPSPACSCGGAQSQLEVVGVRWERK